MDRRTLPRKSHLRKSGDIQTTFREGVRFQGVNVSILARRKEEPGHRVAFVASKRLGNAVKRNRAKRIMREAYRNGKGALSPNTDIILVAKSGILESPYDYVESEVSKLLELAKTIS